MKFIIKKSSDGQFYFVIVAKNGEPLATSEMYTRKAKAQHTIKLIQSCEKGFYDET